MIGAASAVFAVLSNNNGLLSKIGRIISRRLMWNTNLKIKCTTSAGIYQARAVDPATAPILGPMRAPKEDEPIGKAASQICTLNIYIFSILPQQHPSCQRLPKRFRPRSRFLQQVEQLRSILLHCIYLIYKNLVELAVCRCPHCLNVTSNAENIDSKLFCFSLVGLRDITKIET